MPGTQATLSPARFMAMGWHPSHQYPPLQTCICLPQCSAKTVQSHVCPQHPLGTLTASSCGSLLYIPPWLAQDPPVKWPNLPWTQSLQLPRVKHKAGPGGCGSQ